MRGPRPVLAGERRGKARGAALAELLHRRDGADALALRRRVGSIASGEEAHQPLGLAQHGLERARLLAGGVEDADGDARRALRRKAAGDALGLDAALGDPAAAAAAPRRRRRREAPRCGSAGRCSRRAPRRQGQALPQRESWKRESWKRRTGVAAKASPRARSRPRRAACPAATPGLCSGPQPWPNRAKSNTGGGCGHDSDTASGTRRRRRRHRPRGGARHPAGADAAGAGANDPRRDACRSSRPRPDLDDREHHRLSRRHDLRHALRHGRGFQPAAADGRQMGRLGRQAQLHLRAPRRAQVLRRLGRDGGGLRRLAPALGGPRRRRPAPLPPRQGHAGERRQDVQDRAVRALRALDRGARQALDLELLDDAQKGGRERSEPADPRDRRLRPLPLQQGRDPARQPLRLRQEPELRAARRARLGACRRQGGEDRPRHLREHRRRADLARGAAERRDRLLRGAAAGPRRPSSRRTRTSPSGC